VLLLNVERLMDFNIDQDALTQASAGIDEDVTASV
jgi:hypothetical protein